MCHVCESRYPRHLGSYCSSNFHPCQSHVVFVLRCLVLAASQRSLKAPEKTSVEIHKCLPYFFAVLRWSNYTISATSSVFTRVFGTYVVCFVFVRTGILQAEISSFYNNSTNIFSQQVHTRLSILVYGNCPSSSLAQAQIL